MIQQVRDVELLGIPCHIHEERDRIFHWFQIAYIQYPQLFYSVIVCELKLLPHILYRGYVQPFGVSRSTYVVYMVIHAPTARMLTFLGIWQTAYIAPIVIT